MLTFTLRRLLLAIPTLLLISLVIFFLVDLAPGSPASEIPLTVPAEVRMKILEAMGVNEPVYVRYGLWLKQFFYVEPLTGIDAIFGSNYAEGMQRIISYQTRSPVFDIIVQRLPQTLIVIGTAYLVGILIAVPIGIYSAYRQYSIFDQLGTLLAMIGFSVPTFFSGTLLIILLVTVIALGIPSIFGGAIITENMFGVSGIGSALIGAIHANDLPMVQTLAFIFAILIVLFNLIADVLYGLLDPRIRYD